MLRRAIALSAVISLTGCASYNSASHVVVPPVASARQFELTVALDRHGYRLRELSLLEEAIGVAAQSRLNEVSINTQGDALSVAVWNAKKDSETIDTMRKVAREHGLPLEVRPAKAFWVRLSASGAELPSLKRLENASVFESYIKSLRPGLSGVAVTQDGDAAMVQATDLDFGKALAKALDRAFVITQLTATSWRVSWDTQLLSSPLFPIEKQKELLSRTADVVRLDLADPLGLQVYEGGDPVSGGGNGGGVHFLVVEPEHHEAFIESIRRIFGQDQRFVFSEIESSEIRFVRLNPETESAEGHSDELMGAVEKALAPQIKRRIEGDAVIVEAEDPAQNSDVALIVRQALAGRSDLVFRSRRNGGLRVELAREAHLGPVRPVMTASDFVQAVSARIVAAGILPMKVLTLDSERVQVILATQLDADKLRATLSRTTGLTIRMVDEKPKGVIDPALPNGDIALRLPTGEEIWVTPEVIVTGDMIANAIVTEDSRTKFPIIQLRFTDEGRSRFAAATSLHLGKRFAIVINGIAVTAPMILEPILGGTTEINGNFTVGAANALLKSLVPRQNDLLLTVE